MGDYVSLMVDEGVGVIRLDRPPANAIDLKLATELSETAHEAEGRDDVGAVVVWGGPNLFAAGADIKAMAEWTPEEVGPSVDALGAACDLLESVPKVSIAAINGYALGGGLELALGCDFRYAANDANLGQPEIRIGVSPGAGGTQRLTRLIGPGRTRSLVCSGRQVGADEALRIGLVERVEASRELYDAAIDDAREFARGPREALAAAKASIRAALLTPGPEGIAEERRRFLALFGTADQREGMTAFLEKRAPRFGGVP